MLKYTLLVALLVTLACNWTPILGEVCNNIYLKTQCAGLNQKCGTNTTTGLTVTCQDGLYCNTYDGVMQDNTTCKWFVEKGGACDSKVISDPCGPFYSCSSGICIATDYLQYGEACTDNSQCFESLKCNNNTCGKDDSKCSNDYECPTSQFCDGKTSLCTDRYTLGSLCVSNDQCPIWTLCEPIGNQSSHCVQLFSQGEGANCSKNNDNVDYNSCDPTQSLLCDKDVQQCVKQSTQSYTPTSSSVNCNATSGTVCNSFESCICGQEGVGVCLQTVYTTNQDLECAVASKKYYQCLIDNGCDEDKPNQDSCQYKKCGTLYCNQVSACDKTPLSTTLIPSCKGLSKGESLCSAFPQQTGTATSLLIPTVFVICISIVALFFL